MLSQTAILNQQVYQEKKKDLYKHIQVSMLICVMTPYGRERILQRIRKTGISGTPCIPAENHTCWTVLSKPLSETDIFAKINVSCQRTVTYPLFLFFLSFFFFLQEDVQRLKNFLPDQLYDTSDKSLYAIILKDLSNTSYLI